MDFHHIDLIVLVGKVYYWIGVALAIRSAIGEVVAFFRKIKSHWDVVKKFTIKIVNWMKKALLKSKQASK